jgi:hypothetical protein
MIYLRQELLSKGIAPKKGAPDQRFKSLWSGVFYFMKFAYNAKDKPKVIWYDFLEPGIVSYENGKSIALLRKETIDSYLRTFIGLPLVLEKHIVGLTPDKYETVAQGWSVDVRYSEYTGKYQVGILPTSDDAQTKVSDDEGRKYGISCAYNILEEAGGGQWHGIPYDTEYLKIDGTHFALVENPRYEESYRTDVYIPKENRPIAMMVNSKDATLQSIKTVNTKEVGRMSFLKGVLGIFKKDKIKIEGGKEVVNADDSDDLEIDGEKVSKKQLLADYEAEKAEELVKKSLEAGNMVKGEKGTYTVDEIVNSYRARKERKNEDDKKAKEAKEKADKEADEKKNAAEADEKKKKDEEEKLKIERQNAADAKAKAEKDAEDKKHFEALNNKREDGELLLAAGTKVMVSTFSDAVARGKEVA